MHFPTPTVLFALLFGLLAVQILASPLPTFTDIERRWSAGESDVRKTNTHPLTYEKKKKKPAPYRKSHHLTPPTQASIHATHNPRSASPSWPLARAADEATLSFDDLTQKTRRSSSSSSESDVAALRAKLRDFAARLLRSKGETELIEEKRRRSEEFAAATAEPPRLERGKFRYAFTA
ncbi:hypothetical protein Q7P37_008070 [Cladosporium fusiforme]